MIAKRSVVAALVFAGLAAAADAASAATHTVCASGCDFATIQAAVTGSSSGDTIDVHPGTYAENVTVNKSLVLNGAKAGIDARDPSRTGLPATEAVVDGTTNGGKTPFNVTANNVTIDGFTVQGNTNSSTFGTNVLLGAGTLGETIQNNIIQNGITGLYLGSGASTIRQNLFQNNNQPGPASGAAIYTDQFAAGGALTGDTIVSNSFVNNQNAGVLLGSTDASRGDSNFAISANTFSGNGNGLLAINLTGSSFTRNVVADSLGSQVVLGDGVANVGVSENFIQNGATNGLRILNINGGANATGVTFTCNSVTGNGTSGVSLTSGQYSGSLDARATWWGSQTGPMIATNPGGTGQPIVDPDGHVTFNPFLLDGTDSDPTTPGFQCMPKLTIPDVQAPEATPFGFTVRLNNPSLTPVTVAYATHNGSAIAGVDYQSTSGTLTFPAGALAETISVPSLEDNGKNESNETFEVELSSPSGASIARSVGVGTILDATPAPSVSAVSPSSGPTTGGTPVTINGANFTGASAVSFGSASALFKIDSDGQIRAVAPPSAAGPVEVTVTRPSGTSATSSADRFTYLPASSRPTVTHLSETHKTWREGSKLATLNRSRPKHKPPVGTTFKFTLDTAATVTLDFTHSVGSRRVNHKCVPATKRNRHSHRCTRTVSAGKLTIGAGAGIHALRFQGRLSRARKLAPGHYTLVMTAGNATGRSRPVRVSFTIVRG